MSGKEKNNLSVSCPYCGNNPVPHFLTWYFESSDVAMAPLRRALVFNRFSSWLKRWLRRKNLGWHFTRLLIRLGILTEQTDIKRCRVRRAQVLWEEAGKRNIEMRELLLFGKPFDAYIAESYKLPATSCKLVFNGLPRPQNYDNVILDILDDKPLLKKHLAAAGLPVPAGGSAANFRQALRIFESINKPVIVKPRTGSRGRHTTTFVQTEADLRQAVKIAKQLCHWVIVEEQLFGPVFRATVIAGKLAGVLRGDPPAVLGDGVHNISQLISIKNEQPHPGVKDIVMSGEMELFLNRQVLDKIQNSNVKFQTKSKTQMPNSKSNPFDYVPKVGETVNLSEKIGVNYGGASSEDFNICHEDNKELFLRAAAALGDPIIGFDFIIPDITKSWKNQKCGFIEANSLPFINLHHDPLLGQPRNAAALVWDMMGW